MFKHQLVITFTDCWFQSSFRLRNVGGCCNLHFSISSRRLFYCKKSGEENLKDKVDRDIKILTSFIGIYCDNKHSSDKSFLQSLEITGDSSNLCRDCQDLLEYAVMRRRACPLNPKPMCKKCKIHCYPKEYRSKIKEVMRFSGAYLIKHGRFDLLFHYLF